MNKKEIGIGFISGILASSIGFVLVVFVFAALKNMTFIETINAAIRNDSLGSLIVLGAIPNLGAFFFFLRKNQVYQARGVLLATLIAAICIAISKFG